MKQFASILAVLAIVGSACGSNATDTAKEAPASSTPQVTGTVGDTGAIRSATASEGAHTATPTSTSAAGTPVPQAIVLVNKGFGQSPDGVSYAYIIENPNANFAFESISVQIAAYDETGIVLKTDSDIVPILFPKQRLGVAGILYYGTLRTPRVDRIEVQVKAGKTTSSDSERTFTAENVAYRPGRYSDAITGVIVSPYTKDFKNIRVSAIAYDAEGNIIGGGFTFTKFVPANGRAAVEIKVGLPETPTRVELHPALSSLSLLR